MKHMIITWKITIAYYLSRGRCREPRAAENPQMQIGALLTMLLMTIAKQCVGRRFYCATAWTIPHPQPRPLRPFAKQPQRKQKEMATCPCDGENLTCRTHEGVAALTLLTTAIMALAWPQGGEPRSKTVLASPPNPRRKWVRRLRTRLSCFPDFQACSRLLHTTLAERYRACAAVPPQLRLLVMRSRAGGNELIKCLSCFINALLLMRY